MKEKQLNLFTDGQAMVKARQLNLFTGYPEPEKKRLSEPERSIERVRQGVGEDWVDRVLTTIRALPVGSTFTTDDLWSEVPTVREPRAMGAVLRQAAADRLCRPTGRYVKSMREQCHRRPLAEWERT